MADKLMTTNEVADFLGVTVNVLQIWRHKGTGPKYFKLSRRAVRYREPDVFSWLKSRVIETEREKA